MANEADQTVGQKATSKPAVRAKASKKAPKRASKKAVKKATANNGSLSGKTGRSEAKQTQDDVSRREVFYEALDRVRKALDTEEKPSTSTIGNLVQLLKLHKDIAAEEELPHEIRVLWQETHDDPSNDV